MKLIRTEEAVGHVLCHDMTQIIPGKYKDARFRKGHIVTEEDSIRCSCPKKRSGRSSWISSKISFPI